MKRLAKKIFAPALVLLLLASASPAMAAKNRGIMRVTFLYSIEDAGGRSDRLREPMDLFFDRVKRELYIVDAATHEVLIYDQNGMFIQRVKTRGSAPPISVAVDGEGRIYTCDTGSPIIDILDYRGAPLERVQLPGTVNIPGAPIRPVTLSSDHQGRVYALKNAGGMVRIDPDGENHEEIQFAGEGAPNAIYGVTVDPAGRFLFTDMRPYSVVIYDPAAKSYQRFGSPGVLYGQLDRPVGIAADEKGHIFVANTVTHKISAFDREGNFIEEFGRIGERYGEFYQPSKVASDGRDRIFVLENTLKRVQVFQVEFLREQGHAKNPSPTPGKG